MAGRYVVTWDFNRKPSATFYRILHDEFGTSHPAGDYCLIQRSVALCKDDFIASRLVALAEHFGARVESFGVAAGVTDAAVQEARAFVGRILQQRLRHRGRPRGR